MWFRREYNSPELYFAQNSAKPLDRSQLGKLAKLESQCDCSEKIIISRVYNQS